MNDVLSRPNDGFDLIQLLRSTRYQWRQIPVAETSIDRPHQSALVALGGAPSTTECSSSSIHSRYPTARCMSRRNRSIGVHAIAKTDLNVPSFLYEKSRWSLSDVSALQHPREEINQISMVASHGVSPTAHLLASN